MTPGSSNNRRRRQARVLDWNRYCPYILQYYVEENKPLPLVRDMMQDRHDFDAT
jgi:hypothetical protein